MRKDEAPQQDPTPVARRALLTASAIAGGAVALSAAATPASADPHRRQRTGPYWNVRDFGARGDGKNDDMQAIQTAIDTASAAGGGTVFIPAGTYIVSPYLNKRHIQLRSEVDLLGEGDASVIKVKDNAGDYWVILGGFWGDKIVENVRISNLRVDQNPTGNTTCNIDHTRKDTSYFYQFGIGLFNYHNIEVDNVRFDPICGVNTVVLNNDSCGASAVRNCSFTFVKARSLNPQGYDNSAIYLNGRGHVISGNRFRSDFGGGRGAIETHTGTSVVTGNVSQGYETGVNAQASSTSGPRADMTISGNTFSDAMAGIILWTDLQYDLHNVTVENNTISLSNKAHNSYMSWGIGSTNSARFTGTFENITIRGNTIIFDEELTKRDTLNETYTYGIGIVKQGVTMSSVTISGNIIKNCPLSAIQLGLQGKISDVKITDNVVVNSGHYPTDKESYRSGILLDGDVRRAVVSDNLITDTYAEPKGLHSIRVNTAGASYADVVVRGNVARSSQGGLWLDLAPAIDSDGHTDQPLLSATAPPTSGSVRAGQLILVTATAIDPGHTPFGYKALTAGTLGKLTGVTASASSGSATATLSDSTHVSVGDYLTFGTDKTAYQVVYLSGKTVRLDRPVSGSVKDGTSVAFAAPTLVPLAATGQLPAIPDTGNSTLTEVERQLNLVKHALRDYGIIKP